MLDGDDGDGGYERGSEYVNVACRGRCDHVRIKRPACRLRECAKTFILWSNKNMRGRLCREMHEWSIYLMMIEWLHSDVVGVVSPGWTVAAFGARASLLQ